MKALHPYRLGPAAAAITLAASVAACTDRSPTSPEPVAASEAAASRAARDSIAAERLGLTAALQDATSRLVPGLSDRGRAAPLERALARLGAALAAGQAEQVGRALPEARASLDSYADGAGEDASADAPDLAAIRLVLDRLDAPEGR